MKELARVLYGSNNYSLDTPDSDKDYKVIFCPSFHDLYACIPVSNNDLAPYYDKNHVGVIDCRNFDNLLQRGNPNIIEMVYSIEWDIKNEQMRQYINIAKDLFSSGYLRLVYKNFYSAVEGIILNSLCRGGITKKTISRAYYFNEMLKDLVKENFFIDENTWRGKTYVTDARQIRLNASNKELEKLYKQITLELNKNKQFFIEEANNLVQSHDSYAAYLLNLAKNVHAFMENVVVRKNIFEEES